MLIRNKEQLDWVSNSVAKAKVVAWDIEADSLDHRRGKMVGYSLAFGKFSCYIPVGDHYALGYSDAEGLEPLRRAFSDEGKVIAGHNLKFDLHWVSRLGLPFPKGQIVDTMVCAWLADENRELGLKPLAKHYLGYEMTEFKEMLAIGHEAAGKKHNEKATIYDVPIERLAEYGALDAKATLELLPILLREVKREGQWETLWNTEMPFLKVLFEMEERGIRIDVDEAKRLQNQAGDKLAYLEATLTEMAKSVGFLKTKNKVKVREVPFNPGSNHHLREVLFDKMGLQPPDRKTTTGQQSVDDASLKTLQEQYPDNEFVTTLLEYRELSKLKSSFYDALVEQNIDGYIYGSFSQCGTKTGRLSSQNPNLQNLPRSKEVRRLFIAPEGYKLLCSDLSQAELRVAAHLSQDANLLDIYRNDKDIHAETQAMLGCAERVVAKTFSFSTMYSASPRTIMNNLRFNAGVKISLEESKELNDKWFASYPGINIWKAKVVEFLEANGYVANAFGRKRRLPEIWSNECRRTRSGDLYFPLRERAKRQAVNFLIQSFVAEIMKLCMIRLADELRPLGAFLVSQIHDENLGYSPDENVERACKIMEDVMTKTVTISVPLSSDAHYAENWSEAKG
jgi:DNA polymerase-1